MPRKTVPINPNTPYHVGARSLNREWFSVPKNELWSIMEDYLHFISHAFKLQIHAFVLMDNHFHLLLTAPEGNLSRAMLYFMRETSKEMSRISGRINQSYGNRNHKTAVLSLSHFLAAYRYIYRNPVRAGICGLVEEYPFSTLYGLLGQRRLLIPMVEDSILFPNGFNQESLLWLNRTPHPDEDESVRLALRRPEFEIKSLRASGKVPQVDTDFGAPLLQREPGT